MQADRPLPHGSALCILIRARLCGRSHVIVCGRVQGVGFRHWVARQAAAEGLDGWVRNRADGSVEAVFAGDIASIRALIARCGEGPPAAAVSDIREAIATADPGPGFRIIR